MLSYFLLVENFFFHPIKRKNLKDIHKQHKIFSQETWMVAHIQSDNLVVQSYSVALPLQEGGMSYENAAWNGLLLFSSSSLLELKRGNILIYMYLLAFAWKRKCGAFIYMLTYVTCYHKMSLNYTSCSLIEGHHFYDTSFKIIWLVGIAYDSLSWPTKINILRWFPKFFVL